MMRGSTSRTWSIIRALYRQHVRCDSVAGVVYEQRGSDEVRNLLLETASKTKKNEDPENPASRPYILIFMSDVTVVTATTNNKQCYEHFPT